MACLQIVTMFAQSLPVVLIPEQILIAAVGDDVVHHHSGGKLSASQALLAQRISLKEQPSRLPPFCVITAGGSISSQRLRRPFLPMHFAVGACFAQVRAAGITTRTFGFVRHFRLLLQNHVGFGFPFMDI